MCSKLAIYSRPSQSMIKREFENKWRKILQLRMFINYFMLLLMLVLMQLISARQYQFIPARCEDYPGVEAKIGGPLSLCSFPPKYEMPDSEDIEAVVKHIQGLNLN